MNFDMLENCISLLFLYDRTELLLSGRKDGAVFVHCNAGVSRAATVVIAYYMKTQRVDWRTAYQHVKTVRSCIRPNDGFMKQLKEYHPE